MFTFLTLLIICGNVFCTGSGYIQADIVRAVPVTSSDDVPESDTSTLSSTPSKSKPPPNLPAVQVGPFVSVPVLLLPEESEAVEPDPSLKLQ